MPRSKKYESTSSVEKLQISRGDISWTGPLVLNYAEASGGRRNPTTTREIDMSKWKGTQYEQWSRAWLQTVDHVVREGRIALATCVKLANIHSVFFRFLSELRMTAAPASPKDLKPRHFALLRQWLRASYPASNTVVNYHNHIKYVVLAMMNIGLVSGFEDEFFPRNALKRGPPSSASKPLSETELERLVQALKRDLIDLHKGEFSRSSGAAMTVYFLVIALRTGGNPTPLLELTRQSLKPHIVPGMMRLDLAKERASKTYTTPLRGGDQEDEADEPGSIIGVPMDGVAILNRVLEISLPLIDRADPSIKDRIWLFEPERGDGDVLCLAQGNLDSNVPRFVRRHDLRGDDGELLVLNVSRLRKNKAQQLLRISGGDLAMVALLLGNTPAVAGRNYLNITQEVRAEGAAFVGEVLEATLAGSSDSDRNDVAATPVARCRDTKNGALAPRNGADCDQFIHCLGCSSFAIVKSLPDLHRLFSFQAFLRAEIAYYPDEEEFDEWRAHRRRLVELIDSFVKHRFPAALVENARARTGIGLHKFWAIRLQSLNRRGGVNE